MDITTIYLISLAVWKAIDGNEWVKSAFTGILGNRADWAYGRIRQELTARLRNGQISNHDIQRAVYEAYLNASLLACRACLQPFEKSRWSFIDNDAYFSDEAKSLRKISRYLDDELSKFLDEKYTPANILATQGQLEFLFESVNIDNSSQPHAIASQLRNQLLTEIDLLFDQKNGIGIPASFRTSIFKGWHDGKVDQDWFEWVCGFFHEYLKTRPRLSEILEKQWLANLKIDSQILSVQVANVEQSLASMSGHVAELITLIKQFNGKADEILEHSRLIPIILELLQNRSEIPVRHKYLNRFPHYNLANFVGRIDEHNYIKQHFQQHRLLLVHGMGGIGKSTMGKAYISQTAEHYQHIAFVEVADTIAQSMLDKLGTSVDVGISYDPGRNTEDNFIALLELLRHIPNLLLVLDNANNPIDLLTRKDSLESLNATVLITSRAKPDRFIVDKQALSITALPPDDALRLFTKLYGRPLQADETKLVEAILEKAFYHPKLIEVVVTQMRRNDQLSLHDVKTIVDKKRYDDYELNYPDEADEQDKTIYSILLNLFNTDLLTEEQKQLLRYFAVLPAVDIPIHHLRVLLNVTSPNEQRTLMIQLKKLSLTAWLEYSNVGYFSIHGLIQWVVLNRLKPNIINCESLLIGIDRVLCGKTTSDRIYNQIFLPYVKNLPEVFTDQTHGRLANIYSNAALIYGALSDYDMALQNHQRALDIRQILFGPDHSDVAKSIEDIGIIYNRQGRYIDALKYHQYALNIRQSTVGNQIDTAQSLNSIGVAYIKQKEYDLALKYLCQALKIQYSIFGVNHPDTARSVNNIGNIFKRKRQYSKALKLHLKSLKIRRIVLEKDDPDIAKSLFNIGVVYKRQKQYSEALNYHQKALDIRSVKLGDSHLDTVKSIKWVRYVEYLLRN